MKTKNYDLNIYPLDVIKKAKYDYSEIANVTVVVLGKTAKCIFNKCKTDEEVTVKEFGNYLIDLIGSRSISHDTD